MVGLCRDQAPLADPYLVKVPQEVCIDVIDLCWLGCFATNSVVASSAFFVPLAVCAPPQTLRIFLPPHIILTDFLVVLYQGEMPIGLGEDLR